MGVKLVADQVSIVGLQLIESLRNVPQLEVEFRLQPNVEVKVRVLMMGYTETSRYFSSLREMSEIAVMALAQFEREAALHREICELLEHDPENTSFDEYTIRHLCFGNGSLQSVASKWPRLLAKHAERMLRT